MKPIHLTTTCLSLILSASAAIAAIIVPTVESFSSELGNGYGQDRRASYTTSGVGLSGIGLATDTHGNAVNGTMWTTTGTIGTSEGLVNNATDVYIVYNLGAAYDNPTLRVWNYNEIGGFSKTGARDVNIEVGATLSLGTNLGNFTFAQANESNATPAEDFLLVASDVQYVKITILSNYFGEDFTQVGQQGERSDQLTGLSEVRFDTIPEPSALLLSGLGVLALFKRRR